MAMRLPHPPIRPHRSIRHALVTERRGVASVEYAIIAAVVIAVASTGFAGLGTSLASFVQSLLAAPPAASVPTAPTGSGTHTSHGG